MAFDLDEEELKATKRLHKVDKKWANTDTTYCVDNGCKDKCWRHKDNWRFEKDTNYWFIGKCTKKDKGE